VAPDFNVRAMASVEDAYAETIGPARFYLILMSLFAGIGVTTAAVGLFGVLSQAVSQRVHEIGVRMALGADASRIRRLIAKDAIRQVSFGVVLGLAGTFWLTRFIESLLYQVTPHDPVTLSLIVLFYFLVATVATLAPIRRAIRVDPVVALRAM
jgi:putative ABC transport system permease protein